MSAPFGMSSSRLYLSISLFSLSSCILLSSFSPAVFLCVSHTFFFFVCLFLSFSSLFPLSPSLSLSLLVCFCMSAALSLSLSLSPSLCIVVLPPSLCIVSLDGSIDRSIDFLLGSVERFRRYITMIYLCRKASNSQHQTLPITEPKLGCHPHLRVSNSLRFGCGFVTIFSSENVVLTVASFGISQCQSQA